MFKNLLLEEEQDEYSSGEHEERDIQVSISDFDSPKVNVQQVGIIKKLTPKKLTQAQKDIIYDTKFNFKIFLFTVGGILIPFWWVWEQAKRPISSQLSCTG